MFLGWSSTKLLFFVPVGYSIWLPGPIICSDWLKFQRSSSPKLMNWLNPNPAKFGSNRPSGFGEEAWNVKSLQTTDAKWWQYFTWTFGPGELKTGFPWRKIISLHKLVSDLRPIDILTGEITIEVTGVVGASPAFYEMTNGSKKENHSQLSLKCSSVHHRRLCRVKNMLAMYLKYQKAGLAPTTPVTSIVISPVKMSIGRKSLTNLCSEMIFLQGKPVFCTEVFIHFVSHILAPCNVSSV
jgi:hypothetical protein